ncbi:MAG: preprotein translocase subunit SecG [Candidatus Eisenbacteria bacterium]
MFTLLIIIHLLVALALVISILLQRGEAGGLSGAFGGSGNQSLFGGRGAASFLSKATAYLGAGFLLVSFALALVQSNRSQPAAEGRNIIRETVPPSPAAPEGAVGVAPGEALPQGEAVPSGEGEAAESPEALPGASETGGE